MVSKKSQAHVEIILATTLFIGFLIFAFVFLNSSIKTTKDIPTDKIERAIFGELSEEVGKLSVVVKKGCYSLGEVNAEYGDAFYRVSHGDGRYTIYYGNFFDTNGKDCDSEEGDEFVFGGYSEEEMIVEKNIIDFKERYEEDYSGLKQTLGVDNFAFEFRKLDNGDNGIIDDFSVEKKIPGSVDVISKDFPVRVINKRAEISELILNIKVWR